MTKLHLIVQGAELVGTRVSISDETGSVQTTEAMGVFGLDPMKLRDTHIALSLDRGRGPVALIRRSDISAAWEE